MTQRRTIPGWLFPPQSDGFYSAALQTGTVGFQLQKHFVVVLQKKTLFLLKRDCRLLRLRCFPAIVTASSLPLTGLQHNKF